MHISECPKMIGGFISKNFANTPVLIMLVGIQGSGKSTLAENIKKYCSESNGIDVYIHSSDALRKEMYGDASIQEDHNAVFKELHRRIKEDLNQNRVVIYDATNINKKKRKAFLNEISDIINLTAICVCVMASFEDCIDSLNNRTDGAKVPCEVVERTYKNWQPPHYFEGWRDIIFCYRDDYCHYIIDLIEKLKGYDQNNKHHSLDLYQHHKKTVEYIVNHYEDSLFAYCLPILHAANHHDLGKMFCESKDESGESHYYNHNNVSAYLYALYCINKSNYSVVVYVSNLIYWHMLPYDSHCDKALKRIREEYGNNFYNDLILLHEADVAAH